jgi:signal transduction histidine kinase
VLKSRSSHVRTKVVALLASLVALWGFAAFVTLREGLNLLTVNTLDQNVGRPSESLVDALQQERRLSVVYLASHGGDQRIALLSQRTRTDAASRNFRRLAGSSDTRDEASAALRQRITDVFGRLDGVDRVRSGVDAANIDRAAAATSFTDMITTVFRVYGAMAGFDDRQISKEANTLVALSRAREVLAQEDTLLAGVAAAGRFTGSEYQHFVQLVGAQRLIHDDTAAELPSADLDHYRQLVNGPVFTQFRIAEDLVVDKGRAGAPPPIDAQAWNAAIEPVFGQLRDLVLKAADGTVKRSQPAVVGVIVRLGLAGGLGLIAVIASIIISIATARSLVSQLEKLRNAAWELANERLPRVVDRLRSGEEVDIAAEAPPLTFGTDEIGQVGQAFNAVQETAIRVAVEQAELRRGVRDVFLSLARRTQALVHRQLTMLDAMERRENDPENLANLFRVDHLATRMRRNAENLIVLSGAVPGRGWRKPVPLVDVVRAAVAEIEDYERVTVLPVGPTALPGRVVGDVIHLLAELVENATSFSPPDTRVQVGGQRVANGFAIEIEDRGLGMPEADLALANEQLRHPPEFKLSSTARLGLYVVGRLAERHGIRVRLRESAYGGMMAIVLIPSSLVVDVDDTAPSPARIKSARRAALEAGPATGDIDPQPIVSPTVNGAGSRRTSAGLLVRPQSRFGTSLDARLNTESPLAAPIAPAESPQPDPIEPAESPLAARIEPAAEIASEPAVVVEPAAPSEPVTGGETPNGLPRRVRQANLAAPLHNEPAASFPEPDSEGPGRAPADIRQMLSSYQRQTRRGRSDAEHVPPVDSAAGHLVASTMPADGPGDPQGEDH